MKLALATLLMFSALPVGAESIGDRSNRLAYRSQSGYARQEKCFKRVYREEYVPGTFRNPGYVRTYKKRVAVPCEPAAKIYHKHHHHHHGTREDRIQRKHHDDNSCIEGAVLGGIGGAGIGAAASRGDGRLWAIPLGIVGGSMVGCQIDGG